MKILVTGGAGFIASHIAERLIKDKHEITILDNLKTGRKENIPNGCRFIEMDITDNAIDDVFREGRIDAVFHYAAQIDVRFSVYDPFGDMLINIGGSLRLLESCKKHNVDRFIFASSGGAVYGEQNVFPADESHPTNPVSPYGTTKLTVEKYMLFYHNQYGINTTALRFANVYGPRQNPFGEAGVVAIFCKRMLKGEQPYINGDGLQTRDYVYIDDVVKANILALELEGNHAINIGTGVETDVVTIFDMIKNLTGADIDRLHREQAPGEQMRSVIDSALAKKIINWTPEYDFKHGLELTVEYFRDN
ncbi:NAD-dependent epimerase/dehydratase family protein [bacterium]|nr:NAD-dependent epimerase/dehydratase family protein [bacterium]